MKNKKAQLLLTLAGIPALIVIIIIAILLITGLSAGLSLISIIFKNLLLIIGAFIFVIGSLLAFKASEDKNKIAIFVIAFILGLVLIGLNYSGLITQETFQGANTISISQATLKSSNPYLNGQAWLISFVQGTLGQSYYGNFNPSEVADASSSSVEPSKSFSINVEYSPTKCSYPISIGQTPIYNIKLVEFSCPSFLIIGCGSPSESEAKQKSNLPNLLWYGKYAWSCTCFGVGYNELYNVGTLQTESNKGVDFKVKLSIAGSQVAEKSFSTLSGSTGGPLGDIAWLQWGGNLDSGKSCPFTPTNYKAVIKSGDYWKLVKDSDYQTYLTQYKILTGEINLGIQQGTTQERITRLKSMVSTLSSLIQKATTQAYVDGSIINNQDTYNAKYEFSTQSPLIFPLTTMYISADKVKGIGIYTPVPDFQIISGTSNCFQTGVTGYINVQIKNNGEEGGFTAYAECSGSFTGSQNVQGTLAKGEVRTISVPINAQVSKEEKSSCKVIIESTGTTRTINVDTCVKPYIQCIATGNFCEFEGGKIVKRCINGGADSEIVKTCSDKEQCKNGECVSSNGNGNGGGDDSNEEKAKCDILIASNPARYQWVVTETTSWTKNIPFYGWFVNSSSSGYCKDNHKGIIIMGIIGAIVIVFLIFLIIFFLKSSPKARR